MTNLPDPFTPADCDLRGMPYMPLDITRLFDSDFYVHSTGDEFKAAVTLWGKAFLQVPAGSLPDDDRVLAHLSNAGAKWKKVRAMALRGFVKCMDGRLYHPTVSEKALDAWKARLSQRERTEKARAAKAAQRQATETSDASTVTISVTEPVTGFVTGSKGREGKGREDKKEAAQLGAPDPLDRVLAELGWTIDDPKSHHSPSHLRRWLDAGYDLDRHILPVIRELSGRAKARGAPEIGHLRYFDRALAERFAEKPMPTAAATYDPPKNRDQAMRRAEIMLSGVPIPAEWGRALASPDANSPKKSSPQHAKGRQHEPLLCDQ